MKHRVRSVIATFALIVVSAAALNLFGDDLVYGTKLLGKVKSNEPVVVQETDPVFDAWWNSEDFSWPPTGI